MNKFLIILLLIISCNNEAQTKVDTGLLKKAFAAKDEKLFLENFPGNFEGFKTVFGWNDQTEKPYPLYDVANQYIDYFFQLAIQPAYNNYQNKMIDIAANGVWQADGVAYFQTKLKGLVQTDKDFVQLLKNSDEKKVTAFWKFYFGTEKLSYPPELEAVLDASMKAKSMQVFQSIQQSRKAENSSDHQVFEYEVFDKDGYSNLRKEKSATSAILEKVNSGEKVNVLDKSNEWWYVKTKTSKMGYIHKTRIRVVNGASTTAAGTSNAAGKNATLGSFNGLSSKFNYSITAAKFREGGKVASELNINVSDKTGAKKAEVVFKPEYWLKNACSATSYLNKSTTNEGIENYNKFIVGDYNFDGLEDFAIANYEGGNGGPQYAYFLQDNTGNFIKDAKFPLQEGFFPKKIDVKTKSLTISGPVGCCSIATAVYQLKGNNKWEMISSKEEKM